MSAHSEEHEAEDGKSREEKSGKNVVRGSHMLLERRGAIIRCGWTKGDAESKNPGQNSGEIIPNIVATAEKLKQGDGAETAFEKVSHPRVVVVADGAFKHMGVQKPRNRNSKRKSKGNAPYGFPEGEIREDGGIFRVRSEKHRTPLDVG